MNNIKKLIGIEMMNCDPTSFGIVLRLFAAAGFIAAGIWKNSYILILIGSIPLFRLSHYYLSKGS